MIHITSPCDTKEISALNVSDPVFISGVIMTGRDEVHRHLYNKFDKNIAALLKGSILYHCGPIVRAWRGKFEIISCGPTTSIREEPYQAEIIKRYGIKGIIGKGGMGERTLKALKEHGAAYFHAPGGAAALLGECVKEVIDVHFLDRFGVPEAMWVIRVEDLPVIVTMDSKGNSLHEDIHRESMKNRDKILKSLKG